MEFTLKQLKNICGGKFLTFTDPKRGYRVRKVLRARRGFSANVDAYYIVEPCELRRFLKNYFADSKNPMIISVPVKRLDADDARETLVTLAELFFDYDSILELRSGIAEDLRDRYNRHQADRTMEDDGYMVAIECDSEPTAIQVETDIHDIDWIKNTNDPHSEENEGGTGAQGNSDKVYVVRRGSANWP